MVDDMKRHIDVRIDDLKTDIDNQLTAAKASNRVLAIIATQAYDSARGSGASVPYQVMLLFDGGRCRPSATAGMCILFICLFHIMIWVSPVANRLAPLAFHQGDRFPPIKNRSRHPLGGWRTAGRISGFLRHRQTRPPE
ncbi:hypothetical protein BOTBODRAFT_458187 [Botryobasidium botryosum FD-172 SS1]|uniref:Uncharacterized protein n=1 Tax=Botryobasidium botryosum (strain FD-172 SS1) TaxID=930990 RepID=A0A067MHI9_BOTB1|nr:hypothetical protein BOTBODRAFT_458187 [Botryobasidium botryosum FD-172 SS1]